MKKIIFTAIVVSLVLAFSSCTSKNAIDTSKAYLDEYYQHLSQGNEIQCYYHLDKNSADQIEQTYNIGAEDYLSIRSLILGSVVNYEITEESYSKDGENKLVDLDVKVEYEYATVDEKIQVMIKKDGQTSIHVISFSEDQLLNKVTENYINDLKSGDFNKILKHISPYYFQTKTQRDVQDMFIQTRALGGNLLDCQPLEGQLINEPVDKGAYVYQAIIKMDYEDVPMVNRIKVIKYDNQLGIGYTTILPENIFKFFEDYRLQLNEENKDQVIQLYSKDFWDKDDNNQDMWWKQLLEDSNEYGKLLSFEVISTGLDKVTSTDGQEIEILKVELNLQFEKKNTINTFELVNKQEYQIYKHSIKDD